jgi:DNA-binding transcriptional ArsR family regulator
MENADRIRPTTMPQSVEKQYPERTRKPRAAVPAERDVREASELLRVVGDLTRMRILCTLLPGEELSVGELQQALNMSQSAVSHQLRVLRDANLVKFRRAGKLVYYSLADEHVHGLLLGTLEHIRHD